MKTGVGLIISVLAFTAIAVLACETKDEVKPDITSPSMSTAPQTQDDADSGPDTPPPAAEKTVLDLRDITAKPESYEWFDFRPNVKKLILSGAAETEHVAILWYTTEDGGVGLHYHAKTESVYVIDGTQTDAKGVYPTGSMYFNPPGSGHQITKSSGFFILAYAAPPDFTKTDQIGEYTPVRIDSSGDLLSEYPFEEQQTGVRVYAAPLDAMGGMKAELAAIESGSYAFQGNYVLVLDGSCEIDGETHGASKLVVAKSIQPQPYRVTAAAGSKCITLGVSF
jgi:hypothetical protein